MNSPFIIVIVFGDMGTGIVFVVGG